ncbi:hypothetical protein M378DRAFT_173171 [Amanita muscaria Koide BX008]|uniref:C2H2-type domain-containing protein n=1 Tax=Amanita muscaria (strain Koide BX008) TaxID=946122 RepID=A0A0C2RZU5_AMAMK|nr:hypothetical protein M378DRAFT_173171 [Amanita muscaria Koide BX008]
MSNQDQFSCSAHTHDGSSIVEGQANLLNDPLLLPPEATFVQRHCNDVNSIIQFLDVYRQRLHVNVETMRELYHRLQKMMEQPSIRISQVLPIPENDACQSFTELGSSGGGELGTFQYHAPPSVNMDTVRPADALRAVEAPMYSSATVPTQYQTRASLHSVQTSMLDRGHEAIPWQGVVSDYEKRIAPLPPAYASYPQLANSAYGCASEVGLEGSLCMSQQPMNPTAFIDTVEAGRGYTQASIVGSSKGEQTVSSFISGGTKHYRCGCGFESDSKRRMDRHHDSLRHSERKHGCSCGKFFTRVDSLKRHKKRCTQRR